MFGRVSDSVETMEWKEEKKNKYEWNGMKCSRCLYLLLLIQTVKTKSIYICVYIYICSAQKDEIVNLLGSCKRKILECTPPKVQEILVFNFSIRTTSAASARKKTLFTLNTMEECLGSAISRRLTQHKTKQNLLKKFTFCFIIISIQTRTKSYTNAMNKMPF